MSSFEDQSSVNKVVRLLDYTDRDVPEISISDEANFGNESVTESVVEAKAALYAHRDGELSSDEDERDAANSQGGSTDADGLNSSEDPLAHYATLDDDQEGDEFDEFQSAVSLESSELDTEQQLYVEKLGDNGDMFEEAPLRAQDDPVTSPAARLPPLTSDKVDTIKRAMANIKITPRPGADVIVQRLTGMRLGDEQRQER